MPIVPYRAALLPGRPEHDTAVRSGQRPSEVGPLTYPVSSTWPTPSVSYSRIRIEDNHEYTTPSP
jgi:hypothetical protein